MDLTIKRIQYPINYKDSILKQDGTSPAAVQNVDVERSNVQNEDVSEWLSSVSTRDIGRSIETTEKYFNQLECSNRLVHKYQKVNVFSKLYIANMKETVLLRYGMIYCDKCKSSYTPTPTHIHCTRCRNRLIYCCQLCCTVYKSFPAMKRHFIRCQSHVTHIIQYKCPLCGLHLSNEYNFKIHLTLKHPYHFTSRMKLDEKTTNIFDFIKHNNNDNNNLTVRMNTTF